MKILISCEYSGRVRDACSKLGHDVTSCDLLPCEGDPKGKHYQGDVEDIISDNWDMLIAFCPCTYLAVSGARWWAGRQKEQEEALSFVRMHLEADIPKIALENPIGKISSAIRKPDQIIQPWMFGHGEVKSTCLWLKNLPKLVPTEIVDGREPRIHLMAPSPNRQKERSLTYQGIADAMAQQWCDPLFIQPTIFN